MNFKRLVLSDHQINSIKISKTIYFLRRIRYYRKISILMITKSWITQLCKNYNNNNNNNNNNIKFQILLIIIIIIRFLASNLNIKTLLHIYIPIQKITIIRASLIFLKIMNFIIKSDPKKRNKKFWIKIFSHFSKK